MSTCSSLINVKYFDSDTDNMNIAKVLILILLCIYQGECLRLADSTFTFTYKNPIGYGLWRVDGGCQLDFAGQSTVPNSAYIFTRFGVPFKNGTYVDYLGGSGIVSQHTGNQWLVVNVGNSYTNSLSYTVQFDNDVWLGAGFPSGTCSLFTTLAEAQTEASESDILSTDPASTFLGPSSFMSVNSYQYSGSIYEASIRCSFSFPGIQFGEFEAWVRLDFSVPIVYYQDYFEGSNITSATDNTWKVVRHRYARLDSCLIDLVVRCEQNDLDKLVNDGTCQLYTRLDSALNGNDDNGNTTPLMATPTASTTSSLSTSSPVITLPSSTTTTTSPTPPPSVITTPGLSSTTTTTITTVVSTQWTTSTPLQTETTSAQNTPATSIHTTPNVHTTSADTPTAPSSVRAATFYGVLESRDRHVYGTIIWNETSSSTNVLQCCRKCKENGACVAIQYKCGSCFGYSRVDGFGDVEIGNILFVVG